MEAIIAAVVTPILGGAISLVIWQSKKSSDNIHKGINDLHSCVDQVSTVVNEIHSLKSGVYLKILKICWLFAVQHKTRDIYRVGKTSV